MSASSPSLLFRGGRLIPEYNQTPETASVRIEDGRIAAIGPDAEGPADQVIDLNQHLIMPGLIDLYCNFREPGNGQKGTIASESLAAARGGFTTVCAAPETSSVNDSGAVTHLIRDIALARGSTRVLPIGAATRGLAGEHLSDMVGLMNAGCVAVGQFQHSMISAKVLYRCMAYARTFGITLMLRPFNHSLVGDGVAHDGLVAGRLGLAGVPSVAETSAVMEMLLLAEETGVHLHLSQLSCARSVEMIAQAKARDVAVTCDVAMHQLLLTESVLAGFDGRYHLQPPLRTEEDRLALLAGVRSGVIDAIVSQHQPHDPAAKSAPFAETGEGLSTLETVISMGLKLVNDGELDLPSLLRSLTAGPAAVLRRTARLDVGSEADLCVVDTEHSWRAGPENLVSMGRHSPLPDTALPGKVDYTVMGGRLVWLPGMAPGAQVTQ